jgi:hypothetical protein
MLISGKRLLGAGESPSSITSYSKRPRFGIYPASITRFDMRSSSEIISIFKMKINTSPSNRDPEYARAR